MDIIDELLKKTIYDIRVEKRLVIKIRNEEDYVNLMSRVSVASERTIRFWYSMYKEDTYVYIVIPETDTDTKYIDYLSGRYRDVKYTIDELKVPLIEYDELNIEVIRRR